MGCNTYAIALNVQGGQAKNGRAYATVLRLSVVCDVIYCG